MQTIAFLDSIALPLVALCFITYLLYKKNKHGILTFSIATVLAYILDKAIGFFYAVDRPFVAQGIEPLIPHAADPSFPSTHAAISFVFAYCIFQENKVAGALMAILACAIAYSRVYAHLHYFSDILAGALLGLACAWITKHSYRSIAKKLQRG